MHRINANNQYGRFNKISHNKKANFGFVQNKFDDRIYAKRLLIKLEKQKQKEVEERIKEDILLNDPISYRGNKQTTKKLIAKFDRITNEREKEYQLKMRAWFIIFMLIGMVLSSVTILESTHVETFNPCVYDKYTHPDFYNGTRGIHHCLP
jgi:hypothetical protein